MDLDHQPPDFESLMSLGYYLTRSDFDVEAVEETLNPLLEMTPHLLRDPGRPVFFSGGQLLEGSAHKVVGNLWATRERIASSLGIKKEELPSVLGDAIKDPLACLVVEDAPFLENELPVDLLNLPILKYFQGDGGPYVTAGIVMAKDAQGIINASFHRLMRIGKTRFAVRMVKRHLHKIYKETKGDLDIAVAIGLTPATLLPAAMSVDYNTNELEIASALCKNTLGKPLEVVLLSNGLPVPVHTEYVLQGRLLKETAAEGPFVDITGTYDIIRDQPIMEIDKVYHRNNPIFQALLPGTNEHFLLMGLPREPVITQEVEAAGVDVRGVRLTVGGCCWLHGVLAIRKKNPDDGRKAIEAAFRGHRSMKQVVIVDDDIDIFDDNDVEWAIATRFQSSVDSVIQEERGSSLDPSRKEGDVTSKVGMDATKPLNAGSEFDKVM